MSIFFYLQFVRIGINSSTTSISLKWRKRLPGDIYHGFVLFVRVIYRLIRSHGRTISKYAEIEALSSPALWLRCCLNGAGAVLPKDLGYFQLSINVCLDWLIICIKMIENKTNRLFNAVRKWGVLNLKPDASEYWVRK